jgi:hypothetical protein
MEGMDRQIREPSQDVNKLILERYRQLNAAQKIQQMSDMNAFVTQTQMTAVRAAHPNADEFEIRMRVASRWVRNHDLLKQAFGWDVAKMGY